MTDMQALKETLSRINWNHGKGNIVDTKLITDTEGVCLVQLQFGQAGFRFRIKDDRVFARGTSQKIKPHLEYYSGR